MMKDNGTFCVMPWIHLHAWPEGSAYLCCIGDTGSKESVVGDLTKNTIAEVMNNDKMKSIRTSMIKGEKISNCKNCYMAEKQKGYSWRNGFNRQFKDIIPSLIENTKEDGTIDPKLLYVDFRFSNLCNLECRTCGAQLSSSIASTKGRDFPKSEIVRFQERNVLGAGNVVSFSNAKRDFVNDDLMPYLVETRCFYFAGGEPLMQREHFDILTHLHKNKWFDKELRYSTNLSNLKYKGTDLIDLWKDFDNVWLMCSIDHIGDKLNYIRQNVNSQRLFDNFDKLVNTHFKLSITPVISIFNIYYMYEFFEFLDQKNYLDRLHSIEVLYAFGETKSPALLPDYAKTELLEKLKKDSESDLYKKLYEKFPTLKMAMDGLVHYINEPVVNYDFDRFIKETMSYDAVYKQNVKETFPWLGEVIDKHRSKI